MADRSKMASEQRTEHKFTGLLMTPGKHVRLRQVPPVIAEEYKETAYGSCFGVLDEVFAARQG